MLFRRPCPTGLVIFSVLLLCRSSGTVLSARQSPGSGQVRSRWPCRLVVKPTLRGVVDDGLRRSSTLQRQCDALAEARAVVALQWGTMDSQSRARSRMEVRDGVVVAWIDIPPVAEAIEHVGHELQHVLEKVGGLDFEAEARRPGSGVWRAFGGFETQAAIDTGRKVRREVHESRQSRRSSREARMSGREPVLLHPAPERDRADVERLRRFAPMSPESLQGALDRSPLLFLQVERVIAGARA